MSVEEITGLKEKVRPKRIKKSRRKKKPKQETRLREGNLLSHYLGIRSFVCGGGSADDDDPEDWD